MSTTLRLVLVLASFAPGCGPQRRQWTPQQTAGTTTTGSGQTVAATGVVARGTPREMVDQLDGLLRQQGMTPIGPTVQDRLPPNGMTAYAVDAGAGLCYTLAVIGEDEGQDINLVVIDPLGREAVHNVRPDNHPWVSFCAGQAGRFIARVQMSEGQGGYYYGAYVGPGGRRLDLSPFYEEEPPAATSEDASLQENFALLDSDMRARGYERYGETTRGSLEQGGHRNFEIRLEGGRCYGILAVGDTGVTDLDLVLLAPDGTEADRDVGPGARPIVRVCPEQSGNYYMQVRMTQGSGSYHYAPYRWPRGTRGPFGLEGVTWVRLSEVTALLAVEGYEPDPAFTPETGRLPAPGASATHQVELTAGQCYAVVAVGGEGITDLDLVIGQGPTQLASDYGSANAFPSVRHCAQSDGVYTITITAAAGSGDYYYQVFSRTDGS